MKFSLKAKLTILISLLVSLVILATTAIYISSLARQVISKVEAQGEYVAKEIFHEAKTVLAQSRLPAGSNPADSAAVRELVKKTLSADPALNSIMENAIGDSATIYYVAITDQHNEVLVHSDPHEVGQPFTPATPLSSILQAWSIQQLRVIFGPPQVFEVILPLALGDNSLDVRVGVSTIFLRDQLNMELTPALRHSGVAIVLATLLAGLLSYLALWPLETISRRVDQMARGELTEPVKLNRSDEWGILSSKLNLLGEQMRGEKAAFVRLKENLDQLFSNLADGILLFDRQDRLVLASPAASRFLRRPTQTLAHLSAMELFTSDSPLDRLLRDAFQLRRSMPWQVIEMGEGDELPRLAASIQFVEGHGESVGCLVTLRDASTRAQLEDQIDVAAKLAALSRLTSGVAHEVKNPLNAMVLQLEILKSKLANDGERVAPQINTLSAEIRRLDRVVKTFLDFTKPVELRRTETEVTTLIREVFMLAEPQARQNHVKLVLAPNGVLPNIKVDRDLIKQALLNLVINGCQAMPSGGELRVTPHASQQRVELEIADQGVGIPPESRSKIFSLYYTTKPNGTGVGLAMTFRIIQLHNGSIDFSSELNRGTTFKVTLPRA
jgi:signal transduction histidine kinase